MIRRSLEVGQRENMRTNEVGLAKERKHELDIKRWVEINQAATQSSRK